MGRILALAYGVVSYLIFLLTILYAIGFVGNLFVPKSIDSGTPAGSLTAAIIIDVILLSIFAGQHSLMARPFFKRWWTQFVPRPVERSTYVLFASLALILLYWQWRPITDVVWSIQSTAGIYVFYAIFFVGFVTVLLSTFMINHFDLFGLRQVYLYEKGEEYADLDFKVPFLYKYVRHPIYLGFIIAFWAAPTMTFGHALFAVMTTAYILVAIQFEEHDIVERFGDQYVNYRRHVSMLLPLPKKG
jgi:protein-S-isoprenylcysteine O-methyltransferase Ste14